MKYLLTFILCITIKTALFAQFSLGFSRNHSGDNLQYGYDFYIKNSILTLGLKNFINSRNYYSQKQYSYKRQFYADNLMESFGLYATFSHPLIKKINLYFYNEIQAGYLRINTYSFQYFFLPVYIEGDLYSYSAHTITNRKVVVENNFGLSYKNDLGSLFDIDFYAGCGLFFVNDDYSYSDNLFGGNVVITGEGRPVFDWVTMNFKCVLHYVPKKVREKRQTI